MSLLGGTLNVSVALPARCPGCSGADIAARNSFISSLASTLHGAAPKQLAFSGTEGYFAPGADGALARLPPSSVRIVYSCTVL
jgi:hypothetical protein